MVLKWFITQGRALPSTVSSPDPAGQDGPMVCTLLMHVSSDTESYWESLWAGDEYENEYYYLSQLYEAGWQARSMA